ncbi:hypothetical protein J6590_021115 [Homalodisca vitripennis]|nr:hypothetical protein J6590_021115 [Homalodisca vitripennis]
MTGVWPASPAADKPISDYSEHPIRTTVLMEVTPYPTPAPTPHPRPRPDGTVRHLFTSRGGSGIGVMERRLRATHGSVRKRVYWLARGDTVFPNDFKVTTAWIYWLGFSHVSSVTALMIWQA